MKTMLRIALMASSIASVPPAIAGEGGAVANSFFTSLPGVIAQAPAQNQPSHAVATNQSDGTAAFITSSRSAASLFSNHYEGGANN